MHPDLQLEKLSRLPMAWRSIAISASRGSGPALHKLFGLIQTIPKSQSLRLLPAFYPQFDPAKIPDADGTISDDDRGAIGNAFVSLKAMLILVIGRGIPEDLAVELWPRIWGWIEFFWIYPDLLLAVLPRDVEPWTPSFWGGAVCVCFSHLPQVAAIINSIPGVWMLLTEHWGQLLRLLNCDSEVDSFIQVCETVERLNRGVFHGDNFHCIVDGAGGTLDDLTTLIAEHTGSIARFLHRPIPDPVALRLLISGLEFMMRARERDANIISALVNHGIVEDVVSVYRKIADLTVPPAPEQKAFFLVLRTILDSPPGYPSITAALKTGLLHVILIAGQRADVDDTDLKHLLRTSIPNAMVYYSVLSRLQISLVDTELDHSTHDLLPRVRAEYNRFLKLASDRITLKNWYDSQEYISRQACDNMDCCRISSRHDFRRCGRCEQAYYCSRDCQAADWKTPGGHRMRCVNLRSAPSLYVSPGGALKASLGIPVQLSKRDASFLRALVDHDYANLRHSIRMQQILHDTPPPQSIFLSFVEHKSEGRGSLGINGRPYELDWKQVSAAAGAKAGDCYARAERGRGLFETHFVLVAEGGSVRAHIMPMRSTHSAVSDGVKRMRRQIPAGIDIQLLTERFPHVTEELESLLKMEVVEIH
ncbi:hypothetical protein B0H11DRAFT_2061711 [Mycena galericulata]|nr:hypothetical protein B0H11DRAFT_2061711 [Mycena galericulata]